MKPALSLALLPILCLACGAPRGVGPGTPHGVSEPATPKVRYAIAIHGGAGTAPRDPAERAAYERALTESLTLGRDLLASGESSLDAVEAVIRHMEEDPLFNAGRGAVMNALGKHELDASIMDGRDRSCGAVGGVRTVKHPISLARLVMTRTPHVLLAGDGAEEFATEMEVERVDNAYFATERARSALERARANEAAAEGGGTVGCVAVDQEGNLAAGTSTGGLTNKRWGRIGDSPIVGAGTYADNATAAVSCTGIGEEYIRNAIAFDLTARMAYRSLSVVEAAREVIHGKLEDGMGGIIAVGRDGSIALEHNTSGMLYGAADSTGRFEVGLRVAIED